MADADAPGLMPRTSTARCGPLHASAPAGLILAIALLRAPRGPATAPRQPPWVAAATAAAPSRRRRVGRKRIGTPSAGAQPCPGAQGAGTLAGASGPPKPGAGRGRARSEQTRFHTTGATRNRSDPAGHNSQFHEVHFSSLGRRRHGSALAAEIPAPARLPTAPPRLVTRPAPK